MNDNYISCHSENGSINISEEVITGLVKAGVSEIEGVSGLANTSGTELAELMGIKTNSKSMNRGVKVHNENDSVVVDVMILVSYGCKIVSVAKAVQEKVTTIMEATTGMDKITVNVHVSGIAFEK